MTVTPSVIRVSELADEPHLVHGFSTLELGSVGMTHAPDPDAVRVSRRRFAEELGLDPDAITVAGAVHGKEVVRVDAAQELVKGVDALITDRPRVLLFATYADCYPVVLWDPVHRAAGLVHAGWRGTEAGVAPAALQAMEKEFGSQPDAMRAGIGPGICGRCYEVGEEVATRFEARFYTKAGGRHLLDLEAALRFQLEAAGVREIHSTGLCTKETSLLPSHRRTPDGTRFGAIVAIR